MTPCADLSAGQVGYFMAQIKTLSDVHIGDTVTDALRPTAEPLAGYKEPKPMVFSGLYPTDNSDFENLREALGKLQSAFGGLDQTTAAQLSKARDLPPQLRQELLQSADEGYPPGYESLLKSYYKALSTGEK